MHGGASSSQTLIARGVSEANAMALCDCRMQRSRAIAKNITVEFERQGRPVYEVGDIAADQVAATKAGRLRGRASWRSWISSMCRRTGATHAGCSQATSAAIRLQQNLWKYTLIERC